MDAVVFLNLNFSVKNLTNGRPIRETTAAIIMYEIKIWISFNKSKPIPNANNIKTALMIPLEISL
jgi:hypothetical protein